VNRQNGFSLIELMVTVAIIGVLASTAIPAFIKYTRKAKTAEARQNIKKLYDGARQYYMEPHFAAVTDMNALPAQFPLTPGATTGYTADDDCCAMASGGTEERCEPNAALWEVPVWRALHFSMPDPHYYAYYYSNLAGPFVGYSTGAQGDLDCDTEQSLFVMWGRLDPTYADGPVGVAMMWRISELE
jgi:prepilin-type N-terminal cleavage/methylation domain-containing protein